MLVSRHAEQTRIEDLVLVMVDNGTLSIVVLWSQEPVKPLWIIKAVVHHGSHIADLSQVVECIAVELLDSRQIKHLQIRLVQKFNSDNDISHLRRGVFLLKHLECSKRVADTVVVAPTWYSFLFAAVVEAVLRLWCAMEIDDDLKTSYSRPFDCTVKVGSGSLGVRTPRAHKAIKTRYQRRHTELSRGTHIQYPTAIRTTLKPAPLIFLKSSSETKFSQCVFRASPHLLCPIFSQSVHSSTTGLSSEPYFSKIEGVMNLLSSGDASRGR